MSADVQLDDRNRPAPRRVKGETARKTKRVQNGTAPGQFTDFAAIVSLIKKEARLLSARDVRFEIQTGLTKHNRTCQCWSRQELPVTSVEELLDERLNISTQSKHEPPRVQVV